MKFTKMQGLGNDYLYIYSEKEPVNPVELSKRLSDRHFGAGSDGIVYILPSATADFKMRIFNADGSEAKMCGNGIRCVGKYLFDKGYTTKKNLKIETLSGIKTLSLSVKDGKVREVSVHMGKAVVGVEKVLTVCGQALRCIPVSVGNPHCVVFTENAEEAPLTTVGAALEKHPAFEGGVNAEFVQFLGNNELRMRVWERGSGITLACGTGACASAAAAVREGLCRPGEDIQVHLDGGTLRICVFKDGDVVMTGPAETVYEGETTDGEAECAL